MKCPTCVQDGTRSIVSVGGRATTAMAVSEFYDEDGVHHWYDPNTTSTEYWCSRGHRWSELSKSKCPCGQEHGQRLAGREPG